MTNTTLGLASTVGVADPVPAPPATHASEVMKRRRTDRAEKGGRTERKALPEAELFAQAASRVAMSELVNVKAQQRTDEAWLATPTKIPATGGLGKASLSLMFFWYESILPCRAMRQATSRVLRRATKPPHSRRLPKLALWTGWEAPPPC